MNLKEIKKAVKNIKGLAASGDANGATKAEHELWTTALTMIAKDKFDEEDGSDALSVAKVVVSTAKIEFTRYEEMEPVEEDEPEEKEGDEDSDGE